MISFIDVKYINLLSSKLEMFKKKGDFLFNFRCPYCGDSQTNKRKARGYVFRMNSSLVYKCHNCGVTTNVQGLLKFIDTNLYNDYVKETFTDKKRFKKSKADIHTSKPKFKPFKLKTIYELHPDHPVVKILDKRKIPKEFYKKLYFAPNFFQFASQYDAKYNHRPKNDHPRLVIPFEDEQGKIFGFQSRSFGKEEPKYYTTMLDESKPKIFGLERLNERKDIFIVEGPIDSMFLSNAIAVCQSDLRVPKYKSQSILIPDNEPRNKEIVKQLEQCIEEGYRVVIWDKDIQQKDINDMVVSGMSIDNILNVIKKNIFSGLEAKTRLTNWKKI